MTYLDLVVKSPFALFIYIIQLTLCWYVSQDAFVVYVVLLRELLVYRQKATMGCIFRKFSMILGCF